MELSLTNREWKEFFIEDIFNIKSGKRLTKAEMVSGDIPFIGATDSNNGITEFVANKNSSLDKNILGVNYNGSVVCNFYHSYEAVFSDDVKRLSFKEFEGNKYAFLFVKALIMQQKSKYEYGYKFNAERMKRQKILLPITSKGEPDYAFMENYIRQKETELLKQYEKQVSLARGHAPLSENVVPSSEKEWSEFEIGKLFTISAGKSKGLNHLQNVTKGGINYLGATNLNNGVLAYVQKVESMTHRGNSICFIRNGEGSMGFSVYKAEDFIATSDISVGYADFLNKYVGLFITTVADKVRGKYNFGYKRNETRLKKEKMLLPKNSNNEPDYVYMENYMKTLESEKITQYLEYKNKRGTN